MESGIEKAQVLACRTELQRKATQKGSDLAEASSDKLTREDTLINHQNCVIGELIAMNQVLTGRVSELEEKLAQRDGKGL